MREVRQKIHRNEQLQELYNIFSPIGERIEYNERFFFRKMAQWKNRFQEHLCNRHDFVGCFRFHRESWQKFFAEWIFFYQI